MDTPELDRRIQVFATKQEDGTFFIRVECEGFDVDRMEKLFELIVGLQDERTFLTLPVLEDLETFSVDGVRVAVEREPRPRAMTLPDVLVPSAESEPPPAGYRAHLTENGSRVFVRIVE